MSEDEKRILKCCYLLPSSGVSDSLFKQMFPDKDYFIANDLVKSDWMKCKKGVWSMHFQIRKIIIDQKVSGAYFQGFLDSVANLSTDNLSSEDASSLNKLLKHRVHNP